MCSNTFTSAASAAMLVESESGESLSPKYDPPTTAPAVMPRCPPIAAAMPMTTTPTVPAEPHDVPVSIENTTGTRNALR